jgi:diguanylate cyclase (GGDEF)-like protein
MAMPRSNEQDAADVASSSPDILESPAQESLDRITRLATSALQVPVAVISLADQGRQLVKSSQGLDAAGNSRLSSFCANALEQDNIFVVPDALEHSAFCDNPFVVGEPGIRFYSGTPLRMQNGEKIGALWVADRKRRELSADQVGILSDLARLTVDEIELRQIATTDSLTGALTRRGFEIEITREVVRNMRYRGGLSAIAADIDHFKKINDNYGHAAGDLVLQAVVATIKQELRPPDFIGRLGGEEFVVALPETDVDGAMIVAERLRRKIADMVVQSDEDMIQLTSSFGIAGFGKAESDWKNMLGRADVALYQAKQSGRNRCLRHEAIAELF